MSMRYVGGLVTTTVNPYAANVTTSPNYAQYNGIFTLPQQAQAATSGQWCTDPFFKNTALLLRADGTANASQNNTFLDSSSNNFTITRNGNTTQGTFSPYLNLWSNFFDGSGDSLACSATATQLPGDFTIECWVNWSNVGGSGWRTIISNYSSWASGAFFLAMAGTDGVNFGSNNTGDHIYSGSGKLPMDVWNHIAVVRSGSTITIYANGASIGSFTDSTNYNLSQNTFIGKSDASGNTYYGYISNLRVVKGTALYTSNFTPSTTPLTAVSGTSLLTCQSNRFIDNSSNNFTITRNGDVKVTKFSPFNPTTAYSTSVIGGSGYFDGSGDYLSTPSTGQFAPSGDFTISCWYYPTTTRTYQQVLGNYNASASTVWIIEVTSGTGINFYINGATVRISGSGVVLNAWNYLVLARSGSTITGYVNGVSVGTYSQSGTLGSATQPISVGRGGSSTAAGDYGLGYIADVKLIDGSAITTVPTAPQTATTGTKLLLSFTNAGIVDATAMNDLETVGNAQVSTSVKKYGSGSLYFDGTGDWLLLADKPDLQLGTGNFTVECWVYLSATGSSRGFVGKGTSTTGWLLSTNASNQVVFTYGSSTITSATLSGSTWYHIAVCREGTGTNQTKIYVDGTNNGTGTVSTDFNQTNIMYVGADRAGGSAMNGYIDDLRITKGVARYISNFTPPPVALPVQ